MYQPVVTFAGEHCHPSFYSTTHGAFLSGRTAAHLLLAASATSSATSAAAAARREEEQYEDVYNLGAASVADLSTWLQEIQMGERSLEDYKSKRRSAAKRPTRDDNKFVTPR